MLTGQRKALTVWCERINKSPGLPCAPCPGQRTRRLLPHVHIQPMNQSERWSPAGKEKTTENVFFGAVMQRLTALHTFLLWMCPPPTPVFSTDVWAGLLSPFITSNAGFFYAFTGKVPAVIVLISRQPKKHFYQSWTSPVSLQRQEPELSVMMTR